ncbi:MAG TPA: hypothetical protein ENI86_01335, partial [Acidimicrobiales bacterium]|nr:hypothetical protein [Acidimicrobiales bacterium]
MTTMHDDQIDIGEDQVAALVSEQFPALAGLAINRIDGPGTVNAIFRLGDKATARFPLRRDEPGRLLGRLRREAAAAAEFGSVCPVRCPEPLHIGRPGHGYPLPWAIQTWVEGETATPTSCEQSTDLADDLVRLLGGLRACDTGGHRFCGEGRGGVLADHDAWVEECIRRSEGLLGTEAMRTAWSGFRRLPREDPDAMCHTGPDPVEPPRGRRASDRHPRHRRIPGGRSRPGPGRGLAPARGW